MGVSNVLGAIWFLLTIYAIVTWASHAVRLAYFTRLRPAWLHLLMLTSVPLVAAAWPLLLPLSMLPRFRDRTNGAIGFERMWRLAGTMLGRYPAFRRAGFEQRFLPSAGSADACPDPLINPTPDST